MRTRVTALGGSLALVATLVVTPAASAAPTVLASTLTDGVDVNLTSYVNDAPAFASGGDGFGIFSRAGSPDIPFSLLDDSLSIFTGDTLGIVDEAETGPFFGATDTQNADNDGPVTATWAFDVSGADAPLFVNLDLGAMGDFESSDTFEFTASVDGGAPSVATVTIDEDGVRDYTLEGGSVQTLDDPANLGAVELDDDFQAAFFAVDGTGAELVLTFTAETDGGSEALAFRNVVVTSGEPLGDGGDDGGTVATDGLLVSEYVEGSSFNKAVEIYNGTDGPISLAGLEFRLYSNGRPLADGPTSTYAFPAQDLAAGAVFVVTNPSYALGGPVDDTSSAINFNGDDAFTLVDTATDTVVDSFGQVGVRRTYGQNVTLRRVDTTRDTVPDDAYDEDAVWDAFDSDDVSDLGTAPGGTPPPPPPAPECDDTTPTLISVVQGSGSSSPLEGDVVTVRGIVTLADSDLGGFFVQEEDADDDADAATSEGVFVVSSDDVDALAEGSTVEVTGTVQENFGRTQLAGVSEVAVCDVALATLDATGLTLPLGSEGREALEGMLVTTTQDLAVTRLFTAYRFGELGLSLGGPLTQPTAAFAPDDPAAQALADANADIELVVNDRDEAFSQFSPFPWELFVDDLSAGDTMLAGDVIGPLNFSFGEYKVEPLDDRFFPEPQNTDVRAEVPVLELGNDLGAFNVLNYFNTFGDSAELRGATNAEDFAVQTAKIVDTINTLDATVLGLVEIENDYEEFYDDDPTTVPSIVTLVEALNEGAGYDKWMWIQPGEEILTDEGLAGGGLGTDAIAVGLIYQPARTRVVGTAATFDIDSELTGDEDNNRWPLAQTFRFGYQKVTVVVNHFKSKGSTCEDTAGPGFALGEDVGTDLTGNCNLVREYAAEQLLDWIKGKPTTNGTANVAVIGDLNAYDEEGPIQVFEDARYTDVIDVYGDDAFTYKFDGRYGRLDHILVSRSLSRKIDDAAVWQINSRAPVGYLYDNDPVDLTSFGSSDHDPVVVSFNTPGPKRFGGNPFR